MSHFPITESALHHLTKEDPRLGHVIATYGILHRTVEPDLFLSLLKSILGQQISMSAQEAVWTRFLMAFPDPTPALLSEVPELELKAVGTSLRKAQYIQGVAKAFLTPDYHPRHLATLDDEAFITVLTQLKGVGAWTAEMLLLFTLERPDILSFGDSALKKGLMVLHDLPHLSKNEFESYRMRYRPHGSTAALYLWEVATRGVPEPSFP